MIPGCRKLFSKKLDTRQLEILTNFLDIARLIPLRTQDICVEISSECKYCLGLKVEATVKLGHGVKSQCFRQKFFKISHTESTPDEYPQKLAEFILETSYLSRQIIRQTDNLSKYKPEDEFCSTICLETTAGKKTLRTGNIAKI